MFVPVRYTIYGWTPPELSLPEKIQLGGAIAKVGRKHFTASLRHRLTRSAHGGNNTPFTFADIITDAASLRDGKRTTSPPSATLIIFAIFFFGACFLIIATHVALLIPLLVVGSITFGSMLWMHNKIDRWVQSLIDEYTTATVNEKLETTAEPQGRVTLSEGRATIELFKSADASTTMQALAHTWFDELMRDARHQDAPAQIKADLKTLLDWVGVESQKNIRIEQRQHWARGFEQYLMEGNAPSLALKPQFERLRTQLLAVYGSPKKLGNPITDEIRGVFDRLLATDAEIRSYRTQQAKP